MDLRAKKEKRGTKRHKRNSVENSKEKRERTERDEILIERRQKHFEEYVTEYIRFLAEVQIKFNEQPNEPAYQRKFDELMTNFKQNFTQHKASIELRSIYFEVPERPNSKTNILLFNYKRGYRFINVRSFKRFVSKYEHQYRILFGSLGVLVGCEMTSVSSRIVHIKNFETTFDH